MPYSKELNLIFVHIPKNAGTSIESALEIYGEDSSGRKIISEDMVFGDGMQHYTIHEIVSHLKARNINTDINRSFAVIRDPVARFVSHYQWTPTGQKSGRSLEEFFFMKFLPTLGDSDVEARHRWPQHAYICDTDSIIAVRYLINFNNLYSGFDEIKCKLNINHDIKLEHHKKSLTKGDKSSNIPEIVKGFIKEFYKDDYGIINHFEAESAIIDTKASDINKSGNHTYLTSEDMREKAINAILSNKDNTFMHRSFFALACLEIKNSNMLNSSKYFYKHILSSNSISRTIKTLLIYPLILVTKPGKNLQLYLIRKMIKLT